MKLLVQLVAVIFTATWASLAIAQASGATKPPTQPPRMLQTEGGRYVFGQISDFRRDQFMLDTRTGRLWRIVTTKVGKPGEEQEIFLLEPVLYIGSDDKWAPEPR